MARVSGIQNAFIAKGHASNIALGEAYKAMDGSVTKQAMVLSYMDVFLYIGLLFLIVIPFVLLVKGNKEKK
jgi:DHA2 family multidrug resistance protein